MIRRSEWLVSGRVQGVWFRGSTCEQGRALGLNGVARNLADGRVQVIAEGSEVDLLQLGEWLQTGPPQARVDWVERIEPASEEKLVANEFRIA